MNRVSSSGRLIALLCVVFILGCDALTPATPIGEITSKSATYLNREVVVRGTASNATKLPFMKAAFYTVADETGRIIVVTESPLPAEGTRVTVRGVVSDVAMIQGQSLGVHLRQRPRQ